MTRLSIIDLSTGQQPIPNTDESAWIVFNGEIYNYKEIREHLLAKGHKFKTASDTESIVHLYEEYGVDCLQHLEGMFAFAIWDRAKQETVYSSRPYGRKAAPLGNLRRAIRIRLGNKGTFGSPKSQSRAQSCRPHEVSGSGICAGAKFNFSKALTKLMPAHYLIVEGGQVSIKNYWNPNPRTLQTQ